MVKKALFGLVAIGLGYICAAPANVANKQNIKIFNRSIANYLYTY